MLKKGVFDHGGEERHLLEARGACSARRRRKPSLSRLVHKVLCVQTMDHCCVAP